nr:CapA family protein [Paraliobacillus zengyii]
MKLNKMLIMLFAILLLLLVGCLNNEDEFSVKNHNKHQLETSTEKEQLNLVPKTTSIQLAAIGDMLIHERVYNDAQTESGYNFMPMLQKVVPYLSEPTITMANQETMIGGEGIGLSTYPQFNSPYQVGDGLKEAGVDIVSLANNHTLDRGEEAIQNALNYWDEIDMNYTGAYKNEADSQEIRILEEEDIAISFLSYTYGTNGLPVPEGKDYLVNLIDQEAMSSDVKDAEEVSDVIVMNLHFGTEYERMPNDEQKELVQYVADLGVDIIIGHHPHVLQPMEWVEGKSGNKTFVAYSLGNFLSGQDEFYRRIGGMVELTVEKTVEKGEEKIEISAPKFLPTLVDYNDHGPKNYQVLPMYKVTNSQLVDVATQYQEIKAHMSQWMPELEFIESN